MAFIKCEIYNLHLFFSLSIRNMDVSASLQHIMHACSPARLHSLFPLWALRIFFFLFLLSSLHLRVHTLCECANHFQLYGLVGFSPSPFFIFGNFGRLFTLFLRSPFCSSEILRCLVSLAHFVLFHSPFRMDYIILPVVGCWLLCYSFYFFSGPSC